MMSVGGEQALASAKIGFPSELACIGSPRRICPERLAIARCFTSQPTDDGVRVRLPDFISPSMDAEKLADQLTAHGAHARKVGCTEPTLMVSVTKGDLGSPEREVVLERYECGVLTIDRALAEKRAQSAVHRTTQWIKYKLMGED